MTAKRITQNLKELLMDLHEAMAREKPITEQERAVFTYRLLQHVGAGGDQPDPQDAAPAKRGAAKTARFQIAIDGQDPYVIVGARDAYEEVKRIVEADRMNGVMPSLKSFANSMYGYAFWQKLCHIGPHQCMITVSRLRKPVQTEYVKGRSVW
jgi:hypothetical protein